jgi:hypothetical protein
MKLPGYEGELEDYIEELDNIQPAEQQEEEEKSSEPLGYANYSDTLDDSIGGNVDE